MSKLSAISSLILLCIPMSALADHDLFQLSLEQLAKVEVTSASLDNETLMQTPVPVTVITGQMIEQSGARNIKDVLLTYIPNFTHVTDQNEPNIAARGVFTSSQQKILFMVDGHRLNSRSYSMASPDYAISLDKIQQIEVLRGPASSLYGNVALTATINIKLKSGTQLNKTQLTVTAGNQGHKQVNFIYGDEKHSIDYLLWAQFFESSGERIALSPEQIYSGTPIDNAYALLDAYDDVPTFDLGFKAKYQDWQLFINSRQSHYIEPFSGGGLTGEAYRYHDVPLYRNIGPGFGWSALHVNIKNTQQFDSFTWHNELYADKNKIKSSVVINPASQLYGTPFWQEYATGLLSHLSFEHNSVSYLAGMQVETMEVTDAHFNVGSYQNDGSNELASRPLLESGNEQIYSIFGQIKYQISPLWLANIGARYDYKVRHRTANEANLSPRLSIIYNDNSGYNLKLSYAASFVDATYWNRFSQLASFRGAQELKPEHLETLQITPSTTLLDDRLYLAGNLYYNKLKDFIFRDNGAGVNEPNYSNSGKLTSWGGELEARYQQSDFSLHTTIGFQRTISSEKFATTGNKINNIPALTASFVASWDINESLSTSLITRYVSRQHSPIFIQSNGVAVVDPFPNSGVSFNDLEHEVGSATLLDAKLRYRISEQITFKLTTHNLLDKRYYQGGSSLHPYPQAGRNIRASISYQF